MKAEELQILDLVYSLINVGGKMVREPQMVRGIWTDADGGEDVCTIKTDRSDVWYPIETFEPIPITNEILKKNGFEKSRQGDWFFVVENKNNETLAIISYYPSYRLEIESLDVLIGSFESDGIKYIHQLQQAMRLCRIEKEITLN